jgi:hypothetical protein
MTKYSNGTVGAWFGNNRWISTQSDTPVGALIANDPDAEPVYIFDIKGPDGTGTSNSWSRPSFGVKPKFGVDTSDEVVQKIMEILQWRHTNEGPYLFNMYGRQGEHWEWNEAGFVEIMPGVDRETQANLGLGLFHQNNLIDNFNVQYRLNSHRYVPWHIGSQKAGLYDMLYRPIASEHQEQFGLYRTELATMEEEFYYRGITGEIDIARAWDDYVADWYDAGGTEITKWANEAQYGD